MSSEPREKHPLRHVADWLKQPHVVNNARTLALFAIVNVIYMYVEELVEANTVVLLGFRLLYTYLLLRFSVDTLELIIVYVYRIRHRKSVDYEDNFTIGISRLLNFIFYGIYILFLVHVLVIDVFTLLTSLTIALGFLTVVFKDFIVNFINGLVIMFSGKFRLREYVKIGSYKGRIVDITFSHVELLTDTSDLVYVPNATAVASESVNYSRSSVKNAVFEFIIDRELYPYSKKIEEGLKAALLKEYDEIIHTEDHISILKETFEKDHSKWRCDVRLARYSFKIENELRTFAVDKIIALTQKYRKEAGGT